MAKVRHPDVGVTPNPARFREAIAAFKKRVPMPAAEFRALEEAEREFAFTVSGVAQADLVSQVYEGIERAIRDGTTLEDFKADVGEALEQSWGGSAPARIETIFRTNVQKAYSEGRTAVFTAPAVKEARPYWRFETIDDDRRDEDCADCDGVILPADDPWWKTHTPPLHPQLQVQPHSSLPRRGWGGGHRRPRAGGRHGRGLRWPAVRAGRGLGSKPRRLPRRHRRPARRRPQIGQI
jgi:hypothetical protein